MDDQKQLQTTYAETHIPSAEAIPEASFRYIWQFGWETLPLRRSLTQVYSVTLGPLSIHLMEGKHQISTSS